MIFKSLSKQRHISYKFANNGVLIEVFDQLNSEVTDQLIEYLSNHVKLYEKEQIVSRLSLIHLLFSMSKMTDLRQSNSLFIQAATSYFASPNIEMFKQWFDKNVASKHLFNIFR